MPVPPREAMCTQIRRSSVRLILWCWTNKRAVSSVDKHTNMQETWVHDEDNNIFFISSWLKRPILFSLPSLPALHTLSCLRSIQRDGVELKWHENKNGDGKKNIYTSAVWGSVLFTESRGLLVHINSYLLLCSNSTYLWECPADQRGPTCGPP